MTTHPLIWKEANFGVIFEAKTLYTSPGVIDIQSGIAVPAFDSVIEEEIGLGMRVPRDMAIGGEAYLSLIWTPTDATSGTVRWGFDVAKVNVGSTISSMQTYTMDSATNSVSHESILTEISIALTAMTINGAIVGRLFRDATDAADTYAADAAVISARLIYQSNKLGTPERSSPYTDWV